MYALECSIKKRHLLMSSFTKTILNEMILLGRLCPITVHIQYNLTFAILAVDFELFLYLNYVMDEQSFPSS